MSSSDSDAEEPFDPLRDGPLRYCGYANEVGEAFGAWLPVYGVPASYAVAIAYVLVDTYDKAAAAHRKASVLRQGAPAEAAARGGVNLDSLIALLAVERAVDTLLWQLLASVAIPGFTIHQVVHFSHAALVQGAHLDDLQAAPAALAGAVAAIAATFSAPPDAVRPAFRSPHHAVQYDADVEQAMENQTPRCALQVADVLERMLPTMVGLAVIPFIVHPIDNAVHVLLNTTLRRSMRTVICQRGGEAVGLDMCHVEWEGEPSSSIALQTVDGGVSPLAAAAPGSAGTGASGRQSAALGGNQGHLKGAASARDTKTHAISRRASRVLSAMQPAAAINGVPCHSLHQHLSPGLVACLLACPPAPAEGDRAELLLVRPRCGTAPRDPTCVSVWSRHDDLHIVQARMCRPQSVTPCQTRAARPSCRACKQSSCSNNSARQMSCSRSCALQSSRRLWRRSCLRRFGSERAFVRVI